MKKKIGVICSSRATYGYKRRVMQLIQGSDILELQTIVTGMHPLKEYGYTIAEFEKDGLPITTKVDMTIGGDTPTAWAKSLGVEMQSLAQVFEMLKPDLILVTGDRAEMFIAAATSVYMNIGHVDGVVRHAITKLAHLHFASCGDSAQRVVNLGEEPWRVFNTGAPQLDDIVQEERLSVEELTKITGLDFNQPLIVVAQHSVLTEVDQTKQQMIQIMEAVKELGVQALVIWPNTDAGGQVMIEVLNQYQNLPFLKFQKSLNRQVFISLLAKASVLIGNSSVGILEAPTLKLAAVNIGTRQTGRMRARNVIDVGYGKAEMLEGLKKALYSQDFKDSFNILEEIPFDAKLLNKKITY
jgi:GDP/UDP-N,N'-diacetylbacillosamine 2-epimerase (hydrolysing)